MLKICSKCNSEKETEEFYKSSRTKDGYESSCKTCRGIRKSYRYHNINKIDPVFMLKSRESDRERYHRLNYGEKIDFNSESRLRATSKYKKKRPEKILAGNAIQYFNKKEGYQLHHWSYNEEHWKDVIELLKDEHYMLHRFIAYDSDTKMYRRKDTGELLDTREKHESYFKQIKIQQVEHVR